MTVYSVKGTIAALAATFAISTSASAATYSNTTPISLPGSGTSGVASEFPSTVNVSERGAVVNVTVSLFGLTHTYPDDIWLALMNPLGTSVVLMSDSGGSGDVRSIDITFDDDAAAAIPDNGPLSSGSYQVSQNGNIETLPTPAPAFSFGNNLSAFDGEEANGAWTLFVFDDAGGDVGNISGGWALSVEVAAVPLPASLPLLLAGFGALGLARRRTR